MSILRALAFRMAATLFSTWSPVGWPWVSLIFLKWSIVSQQERHARLQAFGPAQHRGKAFLEGAMVGKAGQPVGGGPSLQRLHHVAVLAMRWPPGSRSRPAFRRRSAGNALARCAATVKVPMTSSFTNKGKTYSDSKPLKRSRGRTRKSRPDHANRRPQAEPACS